MFAMTIPDILELKSVCTNPLCYILSKSFEIFKVISLVTNLLSCLTESVLYEYGPKTAKSILLVAQDIVPAEMINNFFL